jgi:hypothetical protein
MRTDFLNNRTVKLFDHRFLGEQRGRLACFIASPLASPMFTEMPMMVVSGHVVLICLVASIPFIFGILMSITMEHNPLTQWEAARRPAAYCVPHSV